MCARAVLCGMASASSQAQGTAAEGAEASGSRSNLAPCRVDDASRRMHTPDGQYRIDCSEIGYAQPSVVSCFVALAEFWAAAGRPSHRTPWSVPKRAQKPWNVSTSESAGGGAGDRTPRASRR